MIQGLKISPAPFSPKGSKRVGYSKSLHPKKNLAPPRDVYWGYFCVDPTKNYFSPHPYAWKVEPLIAIYALILKLAYGSKQL